MIICLFSNSQKISNSLEALHSLGKRESPSDLNEHKIRRSTHGNTHTCLEGKIFKWDDQLIECLFQSNLFLY